MKLPSKVTNLLWRLCKGCLLTNAALITKYVDIAADCPWCHRDVETDLHVMFLCDFAKTVCSTTGMSHLVACSPYETPGTIFERIFKLATKDQCIEAVMIYWSLWSRHNRWVWDRNNGSVFGVRSTASHLFRVWTEAQIKDGNRRIRGEVGDRIWTPPAEGWVKINIDAAVFLNRTIRVGVVIRDDLGRFVGARDLKIADSYLLADPCNGNPGRALFGTIVMDRVQLVKHINPVLVNFAYRSANTVAHVLAQATCSITDMGEWYATPPSFLVRALELDLVQ
ncbi:uncharacterized protein LOC141665634 [Apium graveolens]|uniref:uncharacterized protein LOC141665634 n=1 Tax=Apium graveolens TaxID=4045 RepID=UPI003D7ADCC9